MGLFKVVKKSVTSGLNVKEWVGYSQLKENTSILGRLFKGVFKRPKSEAIVESFDEAVQRLDLSEDDLKQRMKTAKQVVLFCGSAAVLIFFYMFYIFSQGQFLSGLICLMLTVLMSLYTIREHFNLYQMRQRRLGCSFEEYVSSLVGKRK